MTNSQKKDAEKYYESTKDIFKKDWIELSDSARQSFYTKYAQDNGLLNEDAKTYDEYMRTDLETFVETYTTKS